MSKKRIGVLTSGGDCPGLNAVIRGVVKSCHQLGYDCVGFHKGYEGLHDPVQYVHLTPKSTAGILNLGGTILGSTNKGRFAATVGVDNRQELDADLMEGVKQTISQLGIDGLICVGGDGSLAVAQQFHEQGIPVVGVPKTIDNDLSATAFTFGFDSAIECATDALDRLHTTAASHERIMVLEVMGRHAGWIALHSGIAGGGDVILIPEIEWSYEHICHKILHRESQGKRFTLVVVAEGAELPSGEMVGERRNGQQMKLGGVGRTVSEEIERRLHRETRLSILGHLQRGGRPTTFDRVLATQFGAHAVRMVKEGKFGEMICSRPPEMVSVPIIEAISELRRVDPHGPAVQAARALGISFGDRPADEIGQDVFNRRETDKAEALSTVPSEVATPETAPAEIVAAAAVTETLVEEGLSSEAPVTEAPAAEEPTVEVLATEEAVVESESEIVAEPAATVEPVTEPEITEPETTEPEVVAEQEVAELDEQPEIDPIDEIAATAVEMTLELGAATEMAEEEEEEEESVTTEESSTEEMVEEPAEEAVPVAEAEAEEKAEATEEMETTEESASEATEETAVEVTESVETEPVAEVESSEALVVEEETASEEETVTEKAKADPDQALAGVAELVKQRLAEASKALQKSKGNEAKAAAPVESLAAPTDEPFEDDLVEEARSALEEALTD